MNDPPDLGNHHLSNQVVFRLGLDRHNITFPVSDVDSSQVTILMTKLPNFGRFVDPAVHVGAQLSSSTTYEYEFLEVDALQAAAQLNLNVTRGDSAAWVNTTVEFTATDGQGGNESLRCVRTREAAL